MPNLLVILTLVGLLLVLFLYLQVLQFLGEVEHRLMSLYLVECIALTCAAQEAIYDYVSRYNISMRTINQQ